MRRSFLILGLIAVFFATTNINECYPPGSAPKQRVMCGNNFCKVSVHLNKDCDPVDESGALFEQVRVNPNTDVCFFNDATCNFRMTFPSGLFGANNTVVSLAPGECKHLVVLNKAARKKFPYKIQADCNCGGGHGNPEFKVGGGGSGGGGEGGG